MRLAISNIAWDVAHDDEVAALLGRVGIDAIDVAPGKYFGDPGNVADEALARVRRWWSERGIEITGMQALLFGTCGLNVFGPATVQEAMLRYLGRVCRVGAGLGATRLVFGSPKNRDRTGLDHAQALDVAVAFFRRLGDIARSHGVVICLEPNPACYGANFMTTSADTAEVVEALAHPAVRMQLDTGALAINGEDPQAVLRRWGALIGHVHASEPGLRPLGEGATDHRAMAAALQAWRPEQLVSIEMLATADEPHVASIERALAVAISHYRDRRDAGAAA